MCSVDATSLREYVNEVCASHGLPHITLHGLRHTFASLGYHLGVPDKAMQEMGGWADAQTMRNIYTHLSRADVAAGENKVLSFFDQNANEKC